MSAGTVHWTCVWCRKSGTIALPADSTIDQQRDALGLDHRGRSSACDAVHDALGVSWAFSVDVSPKGVT